MRYWTQAERLGVGPSHEGFNTVESYRIPSVSNLNVNAPKSVDSIIYNIYEGVNITFDLVKLVCPTPEHTSRLLIFRLSTSVCSITFWASSRSRISVLTDERLDL